MKRRAAYRNEVKTRLSDEDYEALMRYQVIHGADSTSAALQRLIRLSLFGVIGILPSDLSGVSATTSHIGPRR